MKKYSAVLFLLITLFAGYFALSRPVFAEGTVINAGILPAIWYSTTSVYDGDAVKIYGGIQNHSDNDISGTATFYIDGVSTGSAPFTSHPQSLMEVSYEWHATLGKHNVQIKLSVSNNLIAVESNATTLIVTAAPAGTSLINFQKSIPALFTREIKNVDSFTNSMASSVQSLKIKPVTNKANQKGIIRKGSTTTSASAISAVTDSSLFQSVYNGVLDVLTFILHHWVWTILIVLGIIVIIRFF